MPNPSHLPPRRQHAFESLENRRMLAAPEIVPIKAQTVPAGKSLYVPIATNYDGNDQVAYSVSTTRMVASAEFVPSGNTWIRIDTNLGTMDFQLFDDRAPDTVDRMLGLINAGYFDGLTFHRVVPGFVIQGGDPNGDGSGGPGVTFADEFDPGSIFTGDGQLAMANSGKDTNGSQFFVTTIAPGNFQSPGGPPRFLDFNHTIWGQLVRGSTTRDGIINTPQAVDRSGQATGAPASTVRINNISVIKNRTDAVLRLASTGRLTSGNDDRGTVTVTARTDQGNASTSFRIAAVEDASDSPAILGPISDMTTPRNRSLTFTLTGTDTDAQDTITFAAELIDTSLGTVTTNGAVVTFTPRTNYTGPVDLLVGAAQTGATSRGSSQNPFDTQLIRIGVGDESAVGIGNGTLSGLAGAVGKGIVVATFTDGDTAGGPTDWKASINWGDGVSSRGRISQDSSGTFSVTGDHSFVRRADSYPVEVTIEGSRGAREIVRSVINARDIATLSSRGTLVVNGTSGHDSITLRVVGGKVQASVNGVTKRFNLADVKRLQVTGYEGDDAITASVRSRAATIDAGAGNDVVSTGDGNDVLLGGGGRDRLSGGGGNDTLAGGAGRDVLDGGAGTDTGVAASDDERISIEILA